MMMICCLCLSGLHYVYVYYIGLDIYCQKICNVDHNKSIIALVCSDARPNPDDIRRNKALVKLVLGKREKGNDNKISARWIHAEELLALDTGNWHSECIHHHCGGVYCCPGGKIETRKKLWAAILVPLFAIIC